MAANSEIIAVTNVSGTTWTVTRGVEGTTPVVHSAGFTVLQVITAGFLNGVVQNVNGGTVSNLTAVGIGASAPSAGLNVVGTAASQLVYIEQDGSAGHCLTLNLVGTGGTTQAALNAVSANSAFSCVEVSGTEVSRGTVKIAHHGYSDGSDSGAAGVSIDLQTSVGGSTGTAAQGVFITSTTDAIPGGNAVTVRYNSQDWFVVKGNVGAGNGIVGIGVATGHVPAGMVEIAQKDTTTPGLYMQSIASGTADLIQLKDSGGNLRFQVTIAGNLVARANALMSSALQIGAVSGDFGGGSACISIKHATDPSTNPTGGGIIYVDATGHLCYRGSSGTVTQIASA